MAVSILEGVLDLSGSYGSYDVAPETLPESQWTNEIPIAGSEEVAKLNFADEKSLFQDLGSACASTFSDRSSGPYFDEGLNSFIIGRPNESLSMDFDFDFGFDIPGITEPEEEAPEDPSKLMLRIIMNKIKVVVKDSGAVSAIRYAWYPTLQLMSVPKTGVSKTWTILDWAGGISAFADKVSKATETIGPPKMWYKVLYNSSAESGVFMVRVPEPKPTEEPAPETPTEPVPEEPLEHPLLDIQDIPSIIISSFRNFNGELVSYGCEFWIGNDFQIARFNSTSLEKPPETYFKFDKTFKVSSTTPIFLPSNGLFSIGTRLVRFTNDENMLNKNVEFRGTDNNDYYVFRGVCLIEQGSPYLSLSRIIKEE